MFEQATVIVLGAGASAPFGFPLGTNLYEDLTDGIENFVRRIDKSALGILPMIHEHNVAEFLKDPYSSLAGYLKRPDAIGALPEAARSKTPLELMQDLASDLRYQTSDTIDRFIRDNPRHKFLGKILLCQKILLEMYEREGHDLQLRSFALREYNNSRNWYQRLINHIREGAIDRDALGRNRLTFVTFNYDTSLELALDNSLSATEIHSGTDYRHLFEVLHVNGGAIDLPQTVTNVGSFLLEQSQRMVLIDETAKSEVERARRTAQDAIRSAERIFVMGFHFDPINVATIGLDTYPAPPRIFCLNFDGNVGVQQRIQQLGIAPSNIMSGSSDSPRQIADAIADGFLEQ